MQGLLGTSMDDPRTMAVLQGVAGLLGTRGNLQGVVQGLLGYQGAMQQSKQQKAQEEERALRRQMAELQLQQAQQQAAQQKRAEEYRLSLPSPQQAAVAQALGGGGGPTPANAAAMPEVNPVQQQLHGAMRAGVLPVMDYLQSLQPKPADYKVVGDALLQVGPGGVKEAYKAAPKPDLNSLIVMGPDGQPMVNRQLLDAKREIARAGASNTQVSYGTPVAAVDAQGNPVFIQPSKNGGAPAIIPGMRPPKSAAEERSDQEKAQRDRTGKQMLSALNDAENILKGGKATASGVGNMVDAGARMVGVSTPGAQDAARLESLSGWLVANVPRMEGPQSNFDVQNYMTMAGKVGDRTTPIPERLAALKEVRRLQQKYASINGTPMSEETPQSSGGWSIRPIGGN